MSKREGIMLCYPFSEKRVGKWASPPIIVQRKYDGVRCRAIISKDKEPVLLSSQQNVISSVPHINEQLSNLDLAGDIELDGELYTHGMSWNKINSRVSRTVNIHSDYEAINYHVFDIINEKPNIERSMTIRGMKDFYAEPNLKFEGLELAWSVEDALSKMSDSYEGIILRNPMGLYKRKRSTDILKFKPTKTDTYKITDWKEEVDIYNVSKDSLGSLECEDEDGNRFWVGTGPFLTKNMRKELWKDPDILIGALVRVKYQQLTEASGVPRFPVLLEIMESAN